MNPSDQPKRSEPEIDPLMTVDPLESYDPDLTAEMLATGAPKEQSKNVGELAETVAPPSPQAAAELLATAFPDQEADQSGDGLTDTVAPASAQPLATALPDVTMDEEIPSQIHELCKKLESDWQNNDSEPSLEDYIPVGIDPEIRQSLVRELIVIDVQYRKKKNKSLEADEYVSRLPDCRDAVQSAFSHPSSSYQSGSSAHRSSSAPRGYGSLSVPKSKKSSRSRLQHADDPLTRYRLTDFVARGGLGAVFSATDEELGRVVALKEILPEHASNDRIQEKFLFEAEVTGSLEHPGIVPVYGLGRYEDDQPYYAMRFIRGKSFRDVIEEFHQSNATTSAETFFTRDFRLLLRRLIDTCNAIHYAHERGVLHRDIKPDNIMIGDFGETLVVDWGLAKLMETEPAAKSASIDHGRITISNSGSGTRTSLGNAVGTPMFMSPEQAYGRHNELDGRTDIYSLGAVLFNMVSAQYPIEGDSVRDIILNVRAGKTKNLDSVVPSAPKPLASICRKAMECEPVDRYATAVELAEDIDRWMSDELVRAHIGHETITERAGRLIRRHKSWTISGAAALLAITTVAIVSALLINNAKNREQAAKENEQAAKVEAITFKKDAVDRYRDSREAIDTWLVQSSDALQYFPGTSDVRNRLLQLATEDYEKLALRDSSDPELELERGRALVKLGDLNRMQLDYDTARLNYGTALELFEKMRDVDELSLLFQAEHGNVHTKLALTYSDQDAYGEAKQEFEWAIDELSALAGQSDDPIPLRLLAAAHGNAGELFSRLGNHELAIENLNEGAKQYARLGSASDERSQLGIARIRELLGRVYRDMGQHEKALVYFDEAINGLKPLVDAQPDHPVFFDALASVYNAEASSFRTRGLETQLFESLNASIASYRALRAAMPDVPKYRADLAIILTNFGLALHESGHNKKAEPILVEAHGHFEELVTSYGDQVPQYREELARCRDALGQVFLDTNRESSGIFAAAEASLDQLAKQTKTDDETARLFESLAIVRSHVAQAYAREEKTDWARTKFEEAQKNLEQLMAFKGELPRYANALAHVHYRYALMLHDQNDEQAQSHFERARDVWMGIESPAASYVQDLARMLATCPVESVADPDTSLRFARQAVELAPGNSHFLTTQALATLLSGKSDQALKLLEEAKTQRGHWIDRDFFVLAIAQRLSGKDEDARQSFSAAAAWMDENRPFNADLQLLRKLAASRLKNGAI